MERDNRLIFFYHCRDLFILLQIKNFFVMKSLSLKIKYNGTIGAEF